MRERSAAKLLRQQYWLFEIKALLQQVRHREPMPFSYTINCRREPKIALVSHAFLLKLLEFQGDGIAEGNGKDNAILIYSRGEFDMSI